MASTKTKDETLSKLSEIRTQNSFNRRGPPWTEDEMDKLKMMRAQNLSFEECSKRLPGRSAHSCIGAMHRFLNPKPKVGRVKTSYKTREGDITMGNWSTSRLIEPWAQYHARKKAERAAAKAEKAAVEHHLTVDAP